MTAATAQLPAAPGAGPGPGLAELSPLAAWERAEAEVGRPLMVEAAAGGGGKGLRVVRSAADLEAVLAAARREARTTFGDDTLLVERLVEGARHTEAQVLADAHGNVVHLLERDRSTQRRHQKVLEDAPAPTISCAVRDRLAHAAVAPAREVGYVNAGTVESMVAGEELFFLEMNTRLLVEHPVTDGPVRDPFAAGDGFRLGGPPAAVEVQLEADGRRHVVRVDAGVGVVSDGERRRRVAPVAARRDGCASRSTRSCTSSSSRWGARRVVMEAMKMELSLQAPFDGSPAGLHVLPGDRVGPRAPAVRGHRGRGGAVRAGGGQRGMDGRSSGIRGASG